MVLATLWLFTAQWCSLLIDRVYTVPLATLPSTPLGWNGTYLQFGSSVEGMEGPKGGWSSAELQTGSQIVTLEGPGPGYHQVATLEVDTHDNLVLSAGGHSLALGSRAGTLSGGDGPIPAFAPEPGDTTSATLERSWLSWPTPLETNFMTGQTPSWRRYVYYRTSWKKAYGTRDQAEFGCKPSNLPGTACRSICPNASWCFEHLSDVQPALRKACKCSRL